MENLLLRIAVNPEVMHGRPCINNTRYTVTSILEYLAGGDTVDDVLNEFKDLKREDILACIAFASGSINHSLA